MLDSGKLVTPILLFFLILAPAVKISEAGAGKRTALLINIALKNAVRENGPESLRKISRVLKSGFDEIITMDNSVVKKGGLVPTTANTRKKLEEIGRSEPEFLFVYYLGYGRGNRIAFEGRYFSRNILRSWIEDASAASFCILDVIPPPAATGKKQAVSSLESISADPPHYTC